MLHSLFYDFCVIFYRVGLFPRNSGDGTEPQTDSHTDIHTLRLIDWIGLRADSVNIMPGQGFL